jgi:uncharacterized membrane protein YphA (DoxX/SURF4 family)
MERRHSVNGPLLATCRLVVGSVFVVAAVLKLADRNAFLDDIRHYNLISGSLVLGVANYLPWLELVCASCLLVRWRERAAATLVAMLCGAFTLLTAITWIRGIDVACGCFGPAWDAGRPVLTLLRDVLLSLAAVFVARGFSNDADKSNGGAGCER